MQKPRFKWITQSIAESFEVTDKFVEVHSAPFFLNFLTF